MRVLMPFAGFALAATTAFSYTALAQETTDTGTLDPAAVEALFPKPGYSPYAGNTFRPVRSSATRICTHRSRSMPSPSATSSDLRKPIASLAAKR